MEEAISGDVSLIKAQKADTYGNLYFSRVIQLISSINKQF